MALIICPDCGTEVSDAAPACPKCARPIAGTPPPVPVVTVPAAAPAKIAVTYDTSAAGCLIALVGVVLLFLFPIGTVIGIVLIIMGNGMSKQWRCGACKNKLADKHARLCPVCKATLS